MKMKSFAMVMVSGLLVASLGYALPALAADDSTNNPEQSMLSASADNGVPNSNSGNMLNNNAAPNDMNSTTNPGSDEGTPDTATGDDDY